MTTLRMTRLNADRRRTSLAQVMPLVICAMLTGTIGCDSDQQTTGDAPYRALMSTPLPPPATDKIDYDAHSRTLTFYDLPQSGRWMVQVSGAMNPACVGPDHRLPPGADPDHTYVYYTLPSGRSSAYVSLRQIQAAREMHTSRP